MKGEVVTEDGAEVALARRAELQVVEAISHGKEALWELAEALFAFDEAAGWRRLGHESLEEWLAQPEIGVTKTVYYDLVGAWRKFVIHREIAPQRLKLLDPSKVSIVAEAVAKARVEPDEALSDAETLGYRDLREKYKKKPKPKAESKGTVTKEDEDKPATSTHEGSSVRVEQDDDLPSSHAPSLTELHALAVKRWHRAPGEEQVSDYLAGLGIALAPEVDWSIFEEAAASGAKNPRIPLNTIKAILAWRSQ